MSLQKAHRKLLQAERIELRMSDPTDLPYVWC